MLGFKRKKLELMYDAGIVAFYKDTLETPDGKTVEYDYIKHKAGGGAGVLLVDAEENTYLVRQYRNSINDINLEIPAGAYSFPGEAGEVCARREAEEETGFVPERMYHVSNVVSSIGTFDEKTDIFVGLQLTRGSRHPDETEYIDIVKLSIYQARDKIYRGEIVDSKTIIAILAYFDMKTKGIFAS